MFGILSQGDKIYQGKIEMPLLLNQFSPRMIFEKGQKVSTKTQVRHWDGDRMECEFTRIGFIDSNELSDLVGHIYYYVRFEPEFLHFPQENVSLGESVTDGKRCGKIVKKESDGYQVEFTELVFKEQLITL